MTRPLVRGVFALLAVATIAAFFVTQQLKSECRARAALRRVAGVLLARTATACATAPRSGFDLSEPASVTFSIVDAEGNEVRRIVDDRERKAGDTKHRFRWDGRDDDGARVPDGVYRMRVVRRDESRVINSTKKITVDTEPPRADAGLGATVADRCGRARPERGGAHPLPRAVERGAGVPGLPHGRRHAADRAPLPRRRAAGRRVARGGERRPGRPGAGAGGRLRLHRHACATAPATRASRPTEIPTRRSARPGTGVTVRSFTLAGPLGVVPAGSRAQLEVGPVDRSLRLRALAARRSQGAAPRRQGRRALPGAVSRGRSGRACTSCACGRATSARSGRSRWRACPRRGGRSTGRGRSWCSRRSPGRG